VSHRRKSLQDIGHCSLIFDPLTTCPEWVAYGRQAAGGRGETSQTGYSAERTESDGCWAPARRWHFELVLET
jgi:hypothetical protein